MALIVFANCIAPSSSISSRATDVTTTYRRPNCLTAKDTLWGSSASIKSGRPAGTEQKRHARVQVPPKIMKVATPCFQQEPILGQLADSQTVCKRLPLKSSFMAPTFFMSGISCLNHRGSLTNPVSNFSLITSSSPKTLPV